MKQIYNNHYYYLQLMFSHFANAQKCIKFKHMLAAV